MKTTERVKNKPPTSNEIDKNDDNLARWGRARHEGFKVGRFVQSVPMLFTQDHHSLWMGDIYRGRSAFLILGGPSFAKLDHNKLRQPGMLTMGVNNSPKTFRPEMWTCVDSPSHFVKSIWLDPLIQKFVPICHANKKIFDNDSWKFIDMNVGDCPNVVYYRRNEHFKAKQFLYEETINWGCKKNIVCSAGISGCRTVMLPAIRILFHMGIRRLYLLGCDMNMDTSNKYHFEQDRNNGSIKGNNSTYDAMKKRFAQLKPFLEKENFQIFNCNPDSALKTFEFVDYDTAIRRCQAEMGNINYKVENTKNLYDSKEEEKAKGLNNPFK